RPLRFGIDPMVGREPSERMTLTEPLRDRDVPRLARVTDHGGAPMAENRSMRMLRVVQHVLFTGMVSLGVVRSAFDDGVTAAEVVAGVALLGWYWAGEGTAPPWARPAPRTWLATLSGL